ncbi:MAG TPA: cytochrome P450 [Levilinea sp.]|nr:cytochrome P450 [Levilinea sp.]
MKNPESYSSVTPPGPSRLELLKQLNKIRHNAPEYLLDASRRYGDLVFFDVPRNPAYFINHPDLIKHVLLDNHRKYSKKTMQYNSLSEITGQGLLTSDGAYWLRQRQLMQPSFDRPRLMALDRVIVPAALAMLERWEGIAHKGDPLDVDREMMVLALEIVGKALFSIELSREAKRLVDAVLTALDYIVGRARNPTALSSQPFLLTPRKARFNAAVSTLDLTVYDMIYQRQAAGDAGDDLLGMLLRARDPQNGSPMTPEQVRDEVITILIAGHETVASALTWSCYLLAKNPPQWEQMHAEVSRVLGANLPTPASLIDIPLTGQVFSEALRLYPPAWLITRKAIEADQIDGIDIPAGASIIISPYAVHRHPQFWEDPERFDPSRFSPEREINRPRFAYIPFGGGPRLCIGDQFAMIEAQTVLAMVTQRFRLELLPHRPIEADSLVTIRPRHGLPMKIVRLNPAS